jgi:hypothetical protein
VKKTKLIIAICLTALLAGITILQVFAGASFDFGELFGAPPAGEANWFAWHLVLPDGTPYEILTEDQTNCELGENIGYSEYGDGDTNTEWWIQIENFLFDPRTSPFSDNIYMIFGGLGPTHSGTIWEKTIQWIITESQTDWGVVPESTSLSGRCPVISEYELVDGQYSFWFYGAPGYYHIYRSQNASGANNGASNGQYFWIASVDTDIYGVGTYTDFTDQESWYVVIQADPTTNAPIGCHSETVDPTAAVLSDFSSSFDLETALVELSWETNSDADIMGFNVYRSDEISLSPVKINIEMLPVNQPGSMEGYLYSYTDAEVEFGQTYTYWLDVVDFGGQTSRHGPVTQTAGFSVFVPILQK